MAGFGYVLASPHTSSDTRMGKDLPPYGAAHAVPVQASKAPQVFEGLKSRPRAECRETEFVPPTSLAHRIHAESLMVWVSP
jgi:hypothetical protein